MAPFFSLMETSQPTRPLVVVSNDDGVDALGLEILTSGLREAFDLLVVAPAAERSASSHSVTMNAEWAVQRLGAGRYAVDGTPADCVYVALCQLASRPPSLVISGINRGYNLGTDVFYSGTVAAAAEGVILGVPGVAISAEAEANQETLVRAARFARALVSWVLGRVRAPADTLLNVNVPAGAQAAFSVGALGVRAYPRAPRLDVNLPATGRLRLNRPRLKGAEGCQGQDADIVRSGRISITPLRLDWTHEGELRRLASGLQLVGFEHRERVEERG